MRYRGVTREYDPVACENRPIVLAWEVNSPFGDDVFDRYCRQVKLPYYLQIKH